MNVLACDIGGARLKIGVVRGSRLLAQTVAEWCNARSEMEQLMTCYYTNSDLTGVYKAGDTNDVYVNWGASGYRLPTEAEWEKAARGGLSGLRFPWGDTISEAQANYLSSTNCVYDLSNTGFNPAFNDGLYPYTSPVGYFAANGYGLYDIAGNLITWCWDWMGPYSSDPQSDPRGPSSSLFRVMRGGAWHLNADGARCAVRIIVDSESSAYNTVGIRCVRL